MPVSFSAQSIWSQIAPRITTAVNQAAEEAEDLAREKAPVRKVFHGSAAVHSIMSLRQLSERGRLKTSVPLTSRGRYELRSGRAVFRSASGSTLGGRLRGEIHTVHAESGGTRWVARVVSPTPYAKYVEFGTRHNRAQPYLRPALEQVRESFRARCRAAVARIGRAA